MLVSGAKTVLARPATRVSAVSARIRWGPYQPVRAAKAGWYSTAAIATPATSHAAKNQPRSGDSATPVTAAAASAEPAVITGRGPYRSSHRPTGMPASAEATSPPVNAPVVAVVDQPVSAVMVTSAT